MVGLLDLVVIAGCMHLMEEKWEEKEVSSLYYLMV